MRAGIVICSRVDSNRIPNKPFQSINGLPLIEHLIRRCLNTELPVIIAVPANQMHLYIHLREKYKQIEIFSGSANDPLERMTGAAVFHRLDLVVRVCHDKIFIEKDLIDSMLEIATKEKCDYLYSSTFTEGSGFEIISRNTLLKASEQFKNVEHISYAARACADSVYSAAIHAKYRSQFRFLIDYPEDLKLLELVLHSLGNEATLIDAIQFLESTRWVEDINRLPKVTVYTCALNASKFIGRTIRSVMNQDIFKDIEYILIDDFSKDATPMLMAGFSLEASNIKFIRNPKNLGLASSSNVALSQAKAPYIMRIDADDYFTSETSISELLEEIKETKKDIIYPDNYFGSMNEIQSGREHNHIGGALFRRSALNHVKFTEKLMGYDGLDVYLRAKKALSIGYYGKPTFFYRQHKDSMSKNNTKERAEIKKALEESYGKTHQ